MDFRDITFVILTRDEAARIGACLEALPPASPALVYDAESADGTADIARAHGALVVTRPWAGFARAREAAAALVQTNWTCMLDADEALSPELRGEIERAQPEPQVAAYSMPRRNYFCGRWIRGAGWWPDRLVRLFKTGHARIRARGAGTDNALHETWVHDGACVQLNGPIEHHSYKTVQDYRQRFERYTDMEAASRTGSLWRALGTWSIVPLRTAWLALGRGGIFDGWRGLYLSAKSAAYPAVAATKAWRTQRL